MFFFGFYHVAKDSNDYNEVFGEKLELGVVFFLFCCFVFFLKPGMAAL